MKKTAILIAAILAFVTTLTITIKRNTNSSYTLDENLMNQIQLKVHNYTSIDRFPEYLKNAVIAVEDKRFYKHTGIDVIAIARSMYVNLKAHKVVQGGSTITQQLAKNLFLTNDRSFKRKFKEFFYTIGLEAMYTKDQILEMYLNVIYYGSNTYGAENASKRYFHKDIEDLSLSECAMLAGIPNSPNRFNPEIYPDNAKKRQKVVLEAMVRNKYIGVQEKNMQVVLIAR